ncbi:uncharacterized protein LOC111007252 [Momordica charantia]|uniref:Uncharacterized protein LOC111007252 n=1 Tax=Momordica charantia TaxID=3673 RepID=A0A6J1C043_MOMCH|nr:uncharacterized protein LOC111007252 [Momordica charantia]
MSVKFASFSCSLPSLPSPSDTRRSLQLSLSQGLYGSQQHNFQRLTFAKVESIKLVHGSLKSWRGFPKRQNVLSAISEDQSTLCSELVDPEQVNQHPTDEDISLENNSFLYYEGTGGKPGFISFYNHSYKEGNRVPLSSTQRNEYNFLWFVGPAVLVASFIFPSLYLRKILSNIFEDSLLTDFLILFFTEALFYCGVAVFLFLIDCSRRPTEPDTVKNYYETLSNQFGQRISSVATLVLSLIIPMVTMGLVWPWTGPAASATLAPYLVGIVVQFAFEQYARRKKSPSWPVIPVVFQVYRLHQLNRAAQLVTALSFTIKGAEMTPHNLAINSSLGTLLNVLQGLGIICIWSLSSFLMRYFPSNATTMQ